VPTLYAPRLCINGRRSLETLALADFHFILGLETSCFLADEQVVIPGANPRWGEFMAQGRRSLRAPVRSCIWASGEVTVTQLAIASADITAVVAHVGGKRIVVL
jgi:hypothetical protein